MHTTIPPTVGHRSVGGIVVSAYSAEGNVTFYFATSCAPRLPADSVLFQSLGEQPTF